MGELLNELLESYREARGIVKHSEAVERAISIMRHKASQGNSFFEYYFELTQEDIQDLVAEGLYVKRKSDGLHVSHIIGFNVPRGEEK